MRGVCPVTTSEVSDFTVGGYIFEVGGKNKSQKQVHDVENAYVVKDDIEYGMRNVIPLWAFVFLYWESMYICMMWTKTDWNMSGKTYPIGIQNFEKES